MVFMLDLGDVVFFFCFSYYISIPEFLTIFTFLSPTDIFYSVRHNSHVFIESSIIALNKIIGDLKSFSSKSSV